MNEELLLKIYNKYGLNQKGSFDKFKTDMQNPQVQWAVYNKYLTQKGTFEQFQSDLGFVQPQQVDKEAPVENTGTLTPQGQKPTIFQYLADSPVVTPQQLPIQLVSTAIASGGKMVEGVIADQVPQQWATVKQAYASSGIKEADQLIELYNQNPQEGERVFSELEKQGLKIRNAGESFVQALQRMQGEKLNTALKLEDEVVQQKSEFANRTAGTVPEFSEIKGAKDFMNWLGTNVGQAGAQMPVSIGTLGSGSFLMEAAEVYDQQLDLIAESTGLSRKEVIEQGLDDPAAGQAYAILAGALDVASIASVTKLFKNMALGGAKKQLAKEVLEKQLKDSFVKSTAKAGATEFLTEGIQGQLETKGATVGAGTEFEWDWKKFFNEGAAGFVGGAGIGTASRATEYFGAKAALAKIDKIEKEFLAELSKMESEIDIESSTGDPELDRSIDALAAQDADMITGELLKEQQVEGAKFEEERRQEQERVRQAEAAKLQAERKQFLAEKLLEFEKSQTLPRNNDPISRAQAIADEEALQNDISAEGLSPKFETKEIEVPKYDPKTLDKIGTQKANQFTYSDGLGGQATGKIVGKTAVLDEIFAAKDAEGNPVKGTNLYGKVLDRLSKQGVKKLRVGMQSAGSRAALGKLIKDKQLTVDPKGGKDIDGNPIDFLIGDIKVKVPVVKEKVVKEPTVKLPKTVQEPKVKSTTTTAPKTETVSETKKEDTVKKALVKEQAKQEETITKLRDSVQKALQSYAKRPKMLLSRLESLVQKAESAKLPDLAQEIETTRQKYVEKANKSAEAKELAVNRKAKRLTKEEREAKNIATKEENKKKREAKPENKKVTVKANPKLGIKFNNDKETTLGKAKDLYFTEIAKRIYQEKGQAKIQEAVEAYQQFRKDNNLKDVSDESIKSKAQAYTTTARKDIEKTGRQNTLDREEAKKRGLTLKDYREIKDDIKAAEAKGVSLKQYLDDKAKTEQSKEATKFDEAKALADFKRALEGDLGLDEGSIDDIDFATLGNLTKDKLLDYLETHSLQDYKKSDITLEQYIALAPKSQQLILRGLARVINQYKGNRSTTKIVTLTVPDSDIDKVKIGGFHASYSNTDNAYIVILVNEAGTPIGQLKGNNVVLHEYLHDYTKLMFTRAYNLDKKFRLKMERTFNIIKGEIQTKIETIGKKLSSGKPLTTEEQNFYVALKQYTNIKDLNDFVAVDDSVMYAFTDVDEFMSEMFSDTNTVAFLSQVTMDERIKTGIYKGERKSLLYRWFEDLLDYVKEKLNLTPVENNALDYALDSIVEYDVPFSEGQLERLEASEQFELLSIANKKLNQGAPTKKEVKQNLNIVKNITSTLWKRKEIETQNDVLGYIRKVNARLQENQKLGDGYAEVIFDKINKRRSDLKWYKHVKSALDNYLNQKDKTKDFTSKRLDDLKDFSNVNLDNVPFELLSKFMLAYRNLFYNGTVDKAAYNIMIKYGKVKELIKNTEKVAPKISKAAKWVGSISNLTNPSTLSTVIGKYKENVGDLFLSTFFGGLMKSIAQSGIESHNFYKNLTTFAEKNRLTHSNLVKIGMYGGIFSTINDPNNTEAWIDEVLENAQHSLSAAKNKLSAVKDKTYRGHLLEREVKKEIDIAEKILSKLQANPSMDGILDKNEKEFYNRVVSFAKLHENDFFLNTEAIWGNEGSQRRYNYFPTLAQGKVGKRENSDYSEKDELVFTGAESLSEALSGGSTKLRYTDIYSKKVWSNYKRFNPKDYYYEYDALAIGKKWSKRMLYDIYASKEIKALDGLMRDPQTKKLLGDLHPVILKQLKSIVQGTQYTDSGLGPTAMRALKIKDSLYMAALATSGQLIIQASSGIIGAAVLSANLNPVSATKNFSKALKYAGEMTLFKDSPLHKWLDETGMGIQLRDTGFENYLSSNDYRTYTIFTSLRRKAENVTEWAVRSGDKFAARAVWFATYFDAGGTIENPSKEAVLKAERMVGVLQNMSDLSFAAPLFKSNGNLFKRLTISMFYAYKAFSTNAYIAMWTAAPKMFSSSEARKVFAAQFGSVIAYHTIAGLIVRELIYDPLAKAFGDDEDEEDEEKTYSSSEEVLTNTFWDMSVGMISPTFLDQGLRWLFNETAAPSLFENEDGAFDKYLDSPLYSPNKLQDSYKSLLGPGFREAGEIWEASLNAAALEAANKDDMELLDAQIKRGAATEDMLRMVLNTAIGAAPWVPLRGDIKRVLEKARKEKKNKVRKELEMLRSGNSGTILDGEYNSDFNFQDYGTDETLEEFSFEEFLENP